MLEAEDLERTQMSQHKFKVGDAVTFTGAYPSSKIILCEVVRLLPADSVEPAYRIRSKTEKQERVVKEFEIELSA